MKFVLLLFLLHQSVGLYTTRRQLLKMAPLFLVDQNEIKICKNCKFFKKDFSTDTKFGHCSHFPIQETNNYFLVDGSKIHHQQVTIIVLQQDLLKECVDKKESILNLNKKFFLH